MSEVTVALGTKNLRQLARQIKSFAKSLDEDLTYEMCKARAEDVKEDISGNVGLIWASEGIDGNYDSVRVVARQGGMGYFEVLWQGSQIAFLEFGTGATGASTPYPGTAMAQAGYHPDPTKFEWFYEDAWTGEILKSRGVPAYAPMYNAAVKARLNLDHMKTMYKEAVRDAFTVR